MRSRTPSTKRHWHFINLPFVHPADAKVFDDEKLAAWTKAAIEPAFGPPDHGKGPDEPRHAVAALKMGVANLSDPNVSDAAKAVSLCWILHLAGDLHQPLHASALIARIESLPKTSFDVIPSPFDAPEGDAGGNRLAIKTKATLKNAEPLHSYWDGLVFNDRKDFRDVEAKVQELIRNDNLQPNNFRPLENTPEFLDWAKESLELAKTVAYRVDGTSDGGFLPALPLPIRKGKDAREKAAMDLHDLDTHVLSAGYQTKAQETAEKRIVLAGYRLAQLKAAHQIGGANSKKNVGRTFLSVLCVDGQECPSYVPTIHYFEPTAQVTESEIEHVERTRTSRRRHGTHCDYDKLREELVKTQMENRKLEQELKQIGFAAEKTDAEIKKLHAEILQLTTPWKTPQFYLTLATIVVSSVGNHRRLWCVVAATEIRCGLEGKRVRDQGKANGTQDRTGENGRRTQEDKLGIERAYW